MAKQPDKRIRSEKVQTPHLRGATGSIPESPPLISKAEGARCEMCPLKDKKPVFAEAPKKQLKLVLVGEGPGRNEERVGRPFIGKSGGLLENVLSKNGIARTDCYITNAALCRGDGGDREAERAAECCAPRLLRELRDIDAKVPILTMGKQATRSVLGTKSIMVARGFIWTAKEIDQKHVRAMYRAAERVKDPKRKMTAWLKALTLDGRAKLQGRTVLPTIHPAFVLRSDTWLPVFQVDVGRAAKVALGREKERIDDVAHEVGGPELLGGVWGSWVAADIETDGIKPLECKMLCIGLSDGKRTVVLWPWRKSWARPLAKFLRSRSRVVFHNGNNFDLPVLQNHGVVW